MAERQERTRVRGAALAVGVAMAMVGSVFLAPAAVATAKADEKPSSGFRATVLELGGLPLNVRAEATFTGRVVGTVDSGTTIRIGCQTDGPRVVNDIAGYVSTTWDYLPELGGYVSDAWVYTGVDGRIDGVPDCVGVTGSESTGAKETTATNSQIPTGAAPAGLPATIVDSDTDSAVRSAFQRAAAILMRATHGGTPAGAPGSNNDRNHNGIPDDEEYSGNGGFTPNGF